ncbi:hypothetical protein [Rickettsia australis]|uniref:hypothetical protein n=1 Tax=Rickettsia australis TaxID=787 RepID=UPI00030CBDA5|nr:hypothetical protein [Rickettsia australis]
MRAASRIDKNDKEKQELVSKVLKAFDTDMAKNIGFIRAMLEKGKIEDLSMFTKEVNRTKFFSDTQTLVNDFVSLPEPQAKEWPKVQQNQNEQLTNEQKETNKPNDMQIQKQEEAFNSAAANTTTANKKYPASHYRKYTRIRLLV